MLEKADPSYKALFILIMQIQLIHQSKIQFNFINYRSAKYIAIFLSH